MNILLRCSLSLLSSRLTRCALTCTVFVFCQEFLLTLLPCTRPDREMLLKAGVESRTLYHSRTAFYPRFRAPGVLGVKRGDIRGVWTGVWLYRRGVPVAKPSGLGPPVLLAGTLSTLYYYIYITTRFSGHPRERVARVVSGVRNRAQRGFALQLRQLLIYYILGTLVER